MVLFCVFFSNTSAKATENMITNLATAKSESIYKNAIVELVQLAEVDAKNNYKLSLRSLPVRLTLEPFKQLTSNYVYRANELFDHLINGVDMHNGRGIDAEIEKNDQLKLYLASRNVHSGMAHVFGILRRFELSNGTIFTLQPSLIDRLSDLKQPSSKISADWLKLPFQNIYLEFADQNHRAEASIKMNYEGVESIVEGVYLSEINATKEFFSPEMKSHFKVATNTNCRILEIALTFSPLSFANTNHFKAAFASPLVSYFMLFIADNMSLNDCISANLEWLTAPSRAGLFSEKSQEMNELLTLIYNSLLYINLDSRVESKTIVPSITKPISETKPFKKYKKFLSLTKRYTCIKIGSSTTYAPSHIDKNTIPNSNAVRSKAPHPRRGYFGIRHTKNADGDIVPKLTRIKPSIIHKESMNEDDIELFMRNYEVF